MAIESIIADFAKDQLPETWDALLEADAFGEAALQRMLDHRIERIFGSRLSEAEQNALPAVVKEFAGKRFALDLITPGIDFWSKQIISETAGEASSKGYANRALELRQLRATLTAEIAALEFEVEPLLPVIVRRAGSSPKVRNAGDTVKHVTADPLSMEPLYGDASTTTSA